MRSIRPLLRNIPGRRAKLATVCDIPGRRAKLATGPLATSWLCLALGLGLGSCTSDTTPVVYMDMGYQLRCLDCEPRAPDDAGHLVKNVDGEEGLKLECDVARDGGNRRVTFSAEFSDAMHPSKNYRFKLSSGNIDAEESERRCDIEIVEGANTYSGACSSDEPDPGAERPCQATFKVEGDVITGGVYCTAIPNTANLSTTRYVVSPNTRTDAAKFKLYGCAGL